MKQLEKYIRNVLSESAKINFAGHKFVLKVDTNEDPQKKGVKVQFLPTEFESRLEKGLASFDMRVERDRNLKDKTIIGFFIYIEYFDRIIRKALSGENPNTDDPVDEPAEV